MRYVRILSAGLLGISAAVFFGMTVVHALWYEPIVETPALALEPAPGFSPVDLPTRLFIPTIGINADVKQIGLVSPGRMAVPRAFADVGWYKYGPAPGAMGTAVMIGHLDNGLGLSGVFKRLHELRAGDEVAVLTEAGNTMYFRVESLKTYPYDQVPPEELSSSDDIRMILITCAGHWIYTKDQGMTYDHRLVVSARFMSGA